MKTPIQITDSVFYILAALTEPRHGYAIMSMVEETTEGRFVIGPASLYTIIKKLLSEELILLHEPSDSRRKVYELTKKGWEVLQLEVVRRREMIAFANKGLERRWNDDKN